MQHDLDLDKLQAELLDLKAQYGPRLHLKKAPPTSDTSPFPIVIQWSLDAPQAAEAYDISSVKVVVTVRDVTRQDANVASAVDVEVSSTELPAALGQHIASQLHSRWQQQQLQAGANSGLNLVCIFHCLQRDFVTLITSLPQFLEPYQSVNADGATLRRYAIVNPNNQVQIDTHVTSGRQASPPPATAHQHDSSQPSSAWASSARPSISGKGSSSSPAGRKAPSNATNATPASVQSALTYMQRRYGSGLTIHPTPNPSHALSAADPSQLVTSQQGCTFALSIQPTDPAWDAKELHTLSLQGQLSADYPKQGAYTLALDGNQSHISSSAASIVNQLIAAEGRAHAGRPNALQQLLRFVDNRAGMLFHEAEDIVLEAAQRRRHAPSLAQRPSGTVHPGEGATVQPPSQGQAPPPQPPPQRDAGADNAAYRTEHALPSSAAVSSSRHHDTHDDQTTDLGADLASMHMRAESQGVDGSSASASEQDTEGSYSNSQWDSSASYAEHEQQTSDSNYQYDSSDAEPPGGAAAANIDTNDRSGLQLHLQDLNLDNVDAVEGLKLNIQMVCNRCPATHELAFASDAVASGSQQGRSGRIQVSAQCPNCHQDWSACLQPRLLHAHSNVLASITAQGCAPLDLLPSLMAAQCGNCSAAASLRNTQVGVPCSRACSACHTSMTVHFQAAMFMAVPSQGGRAPGGKPSRPRQRTGNQARADPALVVGQPLPHMGTCKHYHHSHRWLRFPCCGRRFACDLCHEEQTDGHEMKWAQRMVCGYCSTEQPLGEQCKHCGKRISCSARGAIGAVTTHWQGGEGCRDKKMMDRRDAAKYRNSKHKSVSKKSTRVGKEGVARRQRGQKADK